MSKLFDSHAHYFDGRFADEFENAAHSILPEIFEGDVEYIKISGVRYNKKDK